MTAPTYAIDPNGILGTDILFEIADTGVATLTLNRPDAANAVTPDQRNLTISLMEGASNDLNIRCVVITAAGDRHFCTGADLRVSVIPVNPGPDDAPDKVLGDVGRNIKRGAQRLIGSIMDCEKPVICAVNGTAAGIGAHIAFASDLVIAAECRLGAATHLAIGCRDEIPPHHHLARLFIAPEGLWIQRMSGIAKTTKAEKVAERKVRIDPDAWHAVTIEIVGDRYRATVDDVVIEARAERFRDAKSLVALITKGQGAQFRNVAIWKAAPAGK